MAWTAKPSTNSFHALSQQGVRVLLNTVSLRWCCCLFLISLLFPSCRRSTKTHPGPVVHLSDSPKDEGKVSRKIKKTPLGFPQAPTLILPTIFRGSFFLPNPLPLSCFSLSHICPSTSTLLFLYPLSLFFLSAFCVSVFFLFFLTSHSLSLSFSLAPSKKKTSSIQPLLPSAVPRLFTYIHRRRGVWGTCG